MMDRSTATISAARSAEQIGSELARQMRRAWGRGECLAAEELLERYPKLRECPESAVDVIYEEYCQRQVAGEQDVEQDILRRFPQWAAALRVMLDCHHRLLKLDDDRPQFPACGECLGEFRLIQELGRGSRGRVFLATQPALADRPVVLKIAPLEGAEHLSLARLQHTNIVPLYGVLDDPARRIRILCMPCFGKATLASLLESLADVPLMERTGQQIVAAMDRMQDSSTPAIASAARQMLASVSYPQAMVWIAACLADALQFAHERGIVHFDLKPSNVLLASDGQPMLLDFHLARAPIRPDAPLPENIGGTRSYMPPEQKAAMKALHDGIPAQSAVDARADIFALGAMLYEALGGDLPLFDQSPALARINPQISIGLSDIVARCVAMQPGDRYATAGTLADDLRRHLTDQPLAGVANRNLAERWNKWRRRRPGKLGAIVMAILVIAAATALFLGKGSQWQDRRQQAELALGDGQRQLDGGHATEAIQTFERGVALVAGLPFRRDLERELRDHLRSARQFQLTTRIHQLAEEVRALYGADFVPSARLRFVASQCDAFWDKRGAILDALGSARTAEFKSDMIDIAIFAADVHARSRSGPSKILEEAEATFGRNPVLEYERSAFVSAPAHTCWEHYALGRAMLRHGDPSHAAQELSKALELDPAGRWANFYYGLCAYRMQRYDSAIVSFSVCIGSSPNIAEYFYNRALAHLQLNQHEQAIADFTRAVDLGADKSSAHYNLALAHLAAGDRTLALQHVRQALAADPTHNAARRLLVKLDAAESN